MRLSRKGKRRRLAFASHLDIVVGAPSRRYARVANIWNALQKAAEGPFVRLRLLVERCDSIAGLAHRLLVRARVLAGLPALADRLAHLIALRLQLFLLGQRRAALIIESAELVHRKRESPVG